MESLHLKYSGTDEDYPQLEFVNTGTGAHAGSIIFKKNKSNNSPDDNDKLGKIIFQGADDINGTLENFSEIIFSSTDVSSGSEDAKIQFKTFADGTLQELLTLESNKVILGGFLTPRLDLIFGAYSPSTTFGSDVDDSTTRSDEYYGLIQTIGGLEGVVSVPYAAEETPTSSTSSYAINKPWGLTGQTYLINSIVVSSAGSVNDATSATLVSGYNFFHISGTPNINGDIDIRLPTPADGKKIVFVIRVKLTASGQTDCNLNFVSLDAGTSGNALSFNDNSLAIIANAPEIARANTSTTKNKLKIVKDYTSNTAVKTKSRVSGYVYCNPTQASSADSNGNTWHYQILAALYAARPGDSAPPDQSLSDDDHDSVRVVFDD